LIDEKSKITDINSKVTTIGINDTSTKKLVNKGKRKASDDDSMIQVEKKRKRSDSQVSSTPKSPKSPITRSKKVTKNITKVKSPDKTIAVTAHSKVTNNQNVVEDNDISICEDEIPHDNQDLEEDNEISIVEDEMSNDNERTKVTEPIFTTNNDDVDNQLLLRPYPGYEYKCNNDWTLPYVSYCENVSVSTSRGSYLMKIKEIGASAVL